MATVKKTDEPTSRQIPASKVTGTPVYNTAGERLGKIEDIILDKPTGKVRYAVLSFGGLLGIGSRHYPIPWEKLAYDPNRGGYVVDLDKRKLENAPSYDANENLEWDEPAWNNQVYEYYEVTYWERAP